MAKIPELSAFFLAYNEEGNIEKLITTAENTLQQVAEKYEIIINYIYLHQFFKFKLQLF